MNVVIGYKFEWSLTSHTGTVALQLGDWQGNSFWVTKAIADPAEFGAIIQILRAEYPLVYTGTSLKTMGTEPAGEDEGG